MSNWIPLLSAFVAALAAFSGYLLNQRAARRQRKAQFYAEALQAVKEFEELPYRIAKRKDSTGETRERLGGIVNDSYVKLSFYQAWLRIDSPRVSPAYDGLARRAARFGAPQQVDAWSRPVIDADTDMDLGVEYYYGTRPELAICVTAMRRELGLLSVLNGRLTRRAVRRQEIDRVNSGDQVGVIADQPSPLPG